MKTVNLVSTLAATLVLAACAQSEQKAEMPMETKKAVETTKTVVYSCLNKKSVTATYTFADQDPVNAIVKLGKKGKEIALNRDRSNADFALFTDGTYEWGPENTLTLATFDQVHGGILMKKGEKVDEILAKSCKVNKKATAKLNP